MFVLQCKKPSYGSSILQTSQTDSLHVGSFGVPYEQRQTNRNSFAALPPVEDQEQKKKHFLDTQKEGNAMLGRKVHDQKLSSQQ